MIKPHNLKALTLSAFALFSLSSKLFSAPKVKSASSDLNKKKNEQLIISQADSSFEIDFEDADNLTGKRRLPLGSILNKTEIKDDYNFITIRKNWHDKILNSTYSLNTVLKRAKKTFE
ncbi:MAG: hypothetical protein CMP11_04005 [Zetaproteobacteria bacterium]|nr:hypothetical protein [Pseudobdellovibrionaceae bacterium]